MLEKVAALSQQIQESKSVSEVLYNPSWEGLDSVLISIQRNQKVAVNPFLASILIEADGFKLIWRYKPFEVEAFQSETIPGGEINIPSVTTIYSLPTKDLLWFEDMAEMGNNGPKYLAFCKRLRLLENLLHSTDNLLIVMTPEWLNTELGYTNPRILYWNTTGSKYLLKLTLETYFDACLEAKAFSGWQCFYVDESNTDMNDQFVSEYFGNNYEEASEKREKFLKEMSLIFPDMDLSKFRELHAKLT